MKKRTPAIQRALKAYNALCERLKSLLPVGSTFPLPQPLSTELKHLRENDQLMQDVYIASSDEPAPAWLVDETVRSGIRAMQSLERCAEEGLRLDREARNVMRWYRRETLALDAACEDRTNLAMLPLLERERARLRRMDLRGCEEVKFCGGREEQESNRNGPAGHPNVPLTAPLTPPATPPRHRRVRFSDSLDVRIFDADREPSDVSDEDDDEDLEEMAVSKSQHIAHRDTFHNDVINISDSDSDPSSESDVDEDATACDPEESEPVNDVDSDVELIEPPHRVPPLRLPPAPKHLIQFFPNVNTLPAHVHHWEELDTLAAAADVSTPARDIWIDKHHLFPRTLLERASWRLLVTEDAWLNDEVIATGLSALACEYPSRLDRFCAVSSFELTRWMEHMDVVGLHRNVSTIAPWSRKAVIVPINEGNTHWVLAVVWPRDGLIEIFDSLARSRRVRPLAMMVYQYMHAITTYARMLNPAVAALPTSWTARPMVSQAHQSNSFDCGVWILCSVAALLNGKRVTALGEQDIPRARAALATLIRKYQSVEKPK